MGKICGQYSTAFNLNACMGCIHLRITKVPKKYLNNVPLIRVYDFHILIQGKINIVTHKLTNGIPGRKQFQAMSQH